MAHGPHVCSLNECVGAALTKLPHLERGICGGEDAGTPALLTPGFSRGLGRRQRPVVSFWLNLPEPYQETHVWGKKMPTKHNKMLR